MIELGTFKVLIRLIKKLDYNIKRSFLMSIGARVFINFIKNIILTLISFIWKIFSYLDQLI
jgi:hypothetical protein